MFYLEGFEDRLLDWNNFRKCLIYKDNSLQLITDYYNIADLHSSIYKPWSKESWPSPWELINDNHYCVFSILLGIGYTYLLAFPNQSNLYLHFYKNSKNSTTDFILQVNENYVLNGEQNLMIIKEIPEYQHLLKTEPLINLN